MMNDDWRIDDWQRRMTKSKKQSKGRQTTSLEFEDDEEIDLRERRRDFLKLRFEKREEIDDCNDFFSMIFFVDMRFEDDQTRKW